MKTLTLLVGKYCGLCEDARMQIRFAQEDAAFEVEEIMIEGDEVLEAEYFLRIPVLMDGDKIVQEGNIDFVTIIEFLTNNK